MQIIRVKNDTNGNPRYVVSWIDFGLASYVLPKKLKDIGWKVYRGKDFGGGFVKQSYNINHDIQEALLTLKGAAK